MGIRAGRGRGGSGALHVGEDPADVADALGHAGERVVHVLLVFQADEPAEVDVEKPTGDNRFLSRKSEMLTFRTSKKAQKPLEHKNTGIWAIG
jgi:hypothetical protein